MKKSGLVFLYFIAFFNIASLVAMQSTERSGKALKLGKRLERAHNNKEVISQIADKVFVYSATKKSNDARQVELILEKCEVLSNVLVSRKLIKLWEHILKNNAKNIVVHNDGSIREKNKELYKSGEYVFADFVVRANPSDEDDELLSATYNQKLKKWSMWPDLSQEQLGLVFVLKEKKDVDKKMKPVNIGEHKEATNKVYRSLPLFMRNKLAENGFVKRSFTQRAADFVKTNPVLTFYSLGLFAYGSYKLYTGFNQQKSRITTSYNSRKVIPILIGICCAC